MFFGLFGGAKKKAAVLYLEAANGDLEGIRRSVQKGADINAKDPEFDQTALHVAVERFQSSAVDVLLELGANPNLMSGRGATPLSIAASIGANAILKRLMATGAVPTIPQNGLSLMHCAAMVSGNPETIELLHQRGISIDSCDVQGRTPLDLATLAGNTAAVLALQRLGKLSEQSDRNSVVSERKKAQDTDGDGPLDVGRDTEERQSPDPAIDRSHPALGMTFPQFIEHFFRHVRFENCITASINASQFPFPTIGAYLDAGEAGRDFLLGLPNLGRTSIEKFENALYVVCSNPAELNSINDSVEQFEAPIAKRLDWVAEIDRLYPNVFHGLLEKYQEAPLEDRELCAILESEIHSILSDPRSAEVSYRRFCGETLTEIGLVFALSRERVRQLESKFSQFVTVKPVPEPVTEPVVVPTDGIKLTWRAMLERLQAYKDAHGDADVPNRWAEDTKLAAWVSAQRQARKRGELIDLQVELLDQLGFSWSLRERGSWDDRIQELTDFYRVNGHFKVPTKYPAAPKLYQFVTSSRFRYKEGELEQERIQQLEALGFPWETSGAKSSESDLIATIGVTQELPKDFSLVGCHVAITGRLENLSRDEASRLIEQAGGVYSDKVSRKVSVLIVGQDPGSKILMAKNLGIHFVNETQFLQLIK